MKQDFSALRKEILDVLGESLLPLDVSTITARIKGRRRLLGFSWHNVNTILFAELEKGHVEKNDQLTWSIDRPQTNITMTESAEQQPSVAEDGDATGNLDISDNLNAIEEPAQDIVPDAKENPPEKPGTLRLDVLRNRLLDLTTRNRLLSLNHRTRSCLRIVDELPNQLYEELMEGDTLSFDPVSHPTPSQLAKYFEETGKDEDPSAEVWARRMGINTSFELPIQAEGEKHADKKIQTVLYAQDLEARLRSLSRAARTAIEESGTNMLYMAFGFLQWVDNEASSVSRYAPLILVPIALERGKFSSATGTYRFKISYSGEDILTNLSLKEKLVRDFGIELPELEEEENPENYFKKIHRLIQTKPQWKVCRFVTVAMFHFGKLLMYLDLDPKRWPKSKNIEKHPNIRRFFEGQESPGLSQATEYDIDNEPELVEQTPLIYEADSSQHSALIDAIQGRNLVIEGPPGSGKSQTITNLIAVALRKRQTVLFISEKLAALEVVRRRLNDAELGNFCLELHSYKTQKKMFLEDIELRIRKSGEYLRPGDLENKIIQFERMKERLKDHAVRINDPYGRIGCSINEIFCAAKYNGQQLGDKQSLVGEYEIEQSEDLIQGDVDDDENCLRVFRAAYERVRERVDSIEKHPWCGVGNLELQPFDIPRVVQALNQYTNAADGVSNELASLGLTIQTEFSTEVKSVKELVHHLSLLPLPESHHQLSLLPAFANEPSKVTELKAFTALLRDIGEQDIELARVFQDHKNLTRETKDHLAHDLSEFNEVAAGSYTAEKLQQIRACLDELIRNNAQIAETIQELRNYWGDKLSSGAQGLQQIRLIIKLCQEAPIAHLSMRDEIFDDPQLTGILNHIYREVKILTEQKETLSTWFNLQIIPDSAELFIAARNMATGGLFHWLKAGWRSSNRLYNSLLLIEKHRGIQAKGEALNQLAQYKERLEKLNGYAQGRQVLKHLFAGEETSLDNIRSLKAWYDQVRARFGIGFGGSAAVGEVLFTLPSQVIRGIAQIGGEEILEQLATAERAVNEIRTLCPSIGDRVVETGLLESSDFLQECQERLAAVLNALSEAEVLPNILTGNLQDALYQCEQWTELTDQADNHLVAQQWLGENFKGSATDIEPIEETFKLADRILSSDLPDEIKGYLLKSGNSEAFENIRQEADQLARALEQYDQKTAAFASLVQLDKKQWFGEESAQVTLGAVVQRAQRALEAEQDLVVWLDYMRSRDSAIKNKLDYFLDLVDQETIPISLIDIAYRYCFFHTLSKQILRENPELRDFRGYEMDELRQRFVSIDKEISKLQREEIAYQIDKRSVPAGVSSGPVSNFSDLGLIQHEIGKQRRHISIRQLVHRAGKALQALKPCFMMGPLSVAQYLKPGALEFDLVVMDEASQMKPEDAMGAIARGKQVVIVGDPKQLPPTTFFDRMQEDRDEDEDEETGVEQSESILQAAAPLFKPMRRLRWHYRSRHESLIAFSNKEFYNNDLVVFPSPHMADAQYGVKWVRINGGLFRNRVNAKEARVIAHKAIDHMKTRKNESLGVVAMNANQKDLIETEVENLLKEDPAALRYIEQHQEDSEPFFVKNLENVQGDERDVIFISFTYGPIESGGPVMQRFGPINQEQGWRRLNVLFTRAKNRVVAFSSMSSDDINVQVKSHLGVKALKNYLAYAATKNLEQPVESGREPDSDFERAVSHALKLKGYECVAQVGVAGFYIDIAVKHPHYPGRFLLGIECDGATYHSGKSVRDRDRLRQAVLENLGWEIHRIWSTDWFKNLDGEIEAVIQRLEKEKERFKEIKLAENKGNDADEEAEEEEEKEEKKEEEALSLLTVEEGRVKLAALREKIQQEMPAKEGFWNFLCDVAIEVLLEKKPVSKQELLVKIPYKLRDQLDPSQFARYHEQVVEILKNVVD
jgi:very-short-patch-repair endonuclease